MNYFSTIMKVIFISLAVFLTNCTYMTSVSQTNIPHKKHRQVKAETHKIIFLGFNFDNDHVLNLKNRLKNQCPDGDVKGILTKSANTMYFGFFVWAQDIQATGYCVPRKSGSSLG